MILFIFSIGLILALYAGIIKRIKSIYENSKTQIRAFLRRIWAFLKDWRNALCFGIAWLITNGWGWFFLIAGPILNLKWMTRIGSAYIAFLWMPGINEKVVTVALAVWLKKILFRRTNESSKSSSSKDDEEE